jgi:LPS sulfotransferase NodH
MLDQLKGSRFIVVLSNYRTGSTALCDYISKQLGYKNVDELFLVGDNIQGWKTYVENTLNQDNVVMKVMPDQLMSPYWQKAVERGYMIGLTRSDKVEQIASMYISHMSDRWHEKWGFPLEEYTVEIDEEQMHNIGCHILAMDARYEFLKKFCQFELRYEDLGILLCESEYKKITKPSNYEEILYAAIDFLKKFPNGTHESVELDIADFI